MVLSKHKADNKTQFIDASGEAFFKKVTHNNLLEEKHIAEIMEIFDRKEDVEYIAKSINNKRIAEKMLSVNEKSPLTS